MNHWKAMLEQDFLTGIMLQRGNGTTQNDTFGYNARSELTSAVSDVDANYNYAYAFDNIGNRTSATEAGTQNTYTTNALNQYDSISLGEAEPSPLQYDADGNATLVRTSTGTWAIEYNGANRPIRFRNDSTDTTVECGYDSQGRRYFKKITRQVRNIELNDRERQCGGFAISHRCHFRFSLLCNTDLASILILHSS